MPIRSFYAVILLLLLTPCASADGGVELNRPVVSQYAGGDGEIWLQYSRFDPDYDFTDYANRIKSSSKITQAETYRAGINYSATDALHFRYIYEVATIDGTRTREPKNVNSRYTSHEIRSQYVFFERPQYMLALEAGYKRHDADRQRFKRFDFIATNLQVTVTPAPGQDLVTVEAKDSAWIAAVRGVWSPTPSIDFSLGVEGRFIEVQAVFNAPDPVIDSLLAKERPQTNPWRERHLVTQIAFNWYFLENWTLGLDFTNFQINRSGYDPKPTDSGDVEYESSQQLDGYLFWNFLKNYSIYAHGTANSHFILGNLPLAYNSRTNHKFKHPFGMLSVGLSAGF